PSTPAKRKSTGFGGKGPLHSNRRHWAGWPARFRRYAVSPRTSTSAAPSTTTSIVHFPRSEPPPLMAARREGLWAPNENVKDAKTATLKKKRRCIQHLLRCF